ncbi:MAG: ABC transporter substrate-binding protein [Desulfovibrionaceae bacterium]
MRRLLAALACAALVLSALPAAAADYTVSISQIVEHPSLSAMQQGFKDRLAELGLSVDYHVHIAQGDTAINEQIANQIVGEHPDLALAIATPSAMALAQKLKDVPLLFTGVTDPVTARLVKSLEHPGGRITGMTDMSPMDQHLALIREFLPGLKTLGIIYNAGEPNSVVMADVLRAECDKVGVTLVAATIDNSSGVYPAAKSLVGRVDAAYIPLDNTAISALESAIKVCRQSKLPLFTGDTDSVERGSVAAVAIDYYQMGRQTADMAARILRDHEDPGDMPVQTIRQFGLYVNKSAAAAMGVAIPPSILARATKVID